MARITLQFRHGSHSRVTRVFAYDPNDKRALCELRNPDGRLSLAQADVGELEAIHDDPQGTYADVAMVLLERAEYVLPVNQ